MLFYKFCVLNRNLLRLRMVPRFMSDNFVEKPEMADAKEKKSQSVKEPNNILLPPDSVRGLQIFDSEKFNKIIVVPWLKVKEKTMGQVVKHVKKYMLKLDNFKPVQLCASTVDHDSDEQKSERQIVLNPLLIKCFEDIDEGDRAVLQNFNIDKDSLKFRELHLTYSNWRADELLKAILPQDKESLTSYSIIGHIVHVNLREHLLPYKSIIGKILLDKVKGAETVVNKVESIDNKYRNFQMEVLCGKNDFVAQVRENHCLYKFDFSSVYWNPRLSSEHERITSKLKAGDILYDVFAGVGPFAIPAAKKKCLVLANDLNPESYKWLLHNIKLNRVENLVLAFNKDGAAFIEEDMKADMLKRWKDEELCNSRMHIAMNLPSAAVEFLKIFKGLFSADEIDSVNIKNFPIVHVYCFVKGEENPSQGAQRIVEHNLGITMKNEILEIFQVRNVSLKKEMMRVTFMLTKALLISAPQGTSKRQNTELGDGHCSKKICAENNGENQNNINKYNIADICLSETILCIVTICFLFNVFKCYIANSCILGLDIF